jgi:hypothetical protein
MSAIFNGINGENCVVDPEEIEYQLRPGKSGVSAISRTIKSSMLVNLGTDGDISRPA